jgi:hypothetical protein
MDSYQRYVMKIVGENPGIRSTNRRLQGRAWHEIKPLIESGHLKSDSGKLFVVKQAEV